MNIVIFGFVSNHHHAILCLGPGVKETNPVGMDWSHYHRCVIELALKEILEIWVTQVHKIFSLKS